MANLFFQPVITALDGNGVPVPNAQLFFYDAGTLNEADVFSDSDKSTVISQPITADAAGRFQVSNGIFLDDQLYRARLLDADDVEIWDIDDIDGTSVATVTTRRQLTAFSGNELMVDSQYVCNIPIDRAMTLAIGASGSQAYAQTAAGAETVFDLQKNGVSIGSCTFAAGGNTGSYSVSSAVSFAAGDRFAIIGPSTADAAIRRVGFNVRFTID